jgi:HlyD family secretion protein
MANVESMIVLAEVYVTEIERVEIGQKARVTAHIFKKDKDSLEGEVIWIASSVGKAQVIPLDPRAAVDRRVVEVKIKLDQPKRVEKLIGHQVDVTILAKPAKESREEAGNE